MGRPRKLKPPEEWTSAARRDDGYVKAMEAEIKRNRVRRLTADELLWSQTGAAYAAELARATDDDPLKPLATRGPGITFTDEELEDF